MLQRSRDARVNRPNALVDCTTPSPDSSRAFRARSLRFLYVVVSFGLDAASFTDTLHT